MMNIQWIKQPFYTWSCLWNLLFLVCCNYFWKDKFWLILKLFCFFKYLCQNSKWKEMNETFVVMLQTENLCFSLRYQLNETYASHLGTITHSSIIFIRISGTIREVKKIYIEQWFGKHCILNNTNKARGWQASLVCSKYTYGTWWESQYQEMFAIFDLI